MLTKASSQRESRSIKITFAKIEFSIVSTIPGHNLIADHRIMLSVPLQAEKSRIKFPGFQSAFAGSTLAKTRID